jgi:hypothetical protein
LQALLHGGESTAALGSASGVSGSVSALGLGDDDNDNGNDNNAAVAAAATTHRQGDFARLLVSAYGNALCLFEILYGADHSIYSTLAEKARVFTSLAQLHFKFAQ